MKPMLLTAAPLRPDSDKYAFEVKWDGPNRPSTVLTPFRALSVGERG
jgi:hypothetical protein